MKLTSFAISVFLLSLASSAAGQLNYVLQARTVSVSVHGQTDASQSVSAPDFGPFDGTATASAGGGDATSHQVSTLSASGISVVGDFHADNPAFAGTGTTRGESLTDVTFSISSPATYRLSGMVAQSSFNTHPRTVRLTGPATNVDLEGPNSFDTSGALAPGQYRLFVDVVSATAFGSSSDPTSGFNASFTVVPEPSSVFPAAVCVILLVARRKRPLTRSSPA